MSEGQILRIVREFVLRKNENYGRDYKSEKWFTFYLEQDLSLSPEYYLAEGI